MLRSLIHLDFSFVWDDKYEPICILLQTPSSTSIIYWRCFLFSIVELWLLCQTSSVCNMWLYFRVFDSITLINLSIFMPTNDWPILRPIPKVESQPQTLLVILFCACRQKLSTTVIWESSSSSWKKQLQRLIAKHWAELRESCRKIRGRNEGVEGVKDTTRRPIDPTDLGS